MKKLSGIDRCRRSPKPKKIDRIVKGVCLYWVIFVLIAWVTYWVKDSVPDTLIQYGLGGGAVELLITGVLEIMRDIGARRADKDE